MQRLTGRYTRKQPFSSAWCTWCGSVALVASGLKLEFVSGDLPHQPDKDRIVGPGSQAPDRCELPNGLADTPQPDESHD